jgi:hypothetical protein
MRSALALAAALALASTVGVARAEPTRQQWQEWKQLNESAQKALREGRPNDAVEALRRADAIRKSPTLDVSLAGALIAAGRLVEAHEIYTRIANSTDPAILWKRARDTAKKALVDLAPRVPSLRVVLRAPRAASLTVDGASATAGNELPLDPGQHTVRASGEGLAPVERTISLAPGEHSQLVLEMAPSGGGTRFEAAPGGSGGGSRVPGGILIGVGGAALVVGGVLGGLAFSAASAAKQHCTGSRCTSAATPDIDRSMAFGNASTGLFIGGGAVTVTGIVLAIVAPGGKSDEAPKAARFQPVLGPGTVGVAGRF